MSYDSWLEQPYQDMYEASEKAEKLQEWIIENSTYTTECCEVDIHWEEVSFDKDDKPQPMVCPECKKETAIIMDEAVLDYPDVDPEDYRDDYWD